MQKDLIFRIAPDAFMLLPSTVYDTMNSFTVGCEADTEAGGILIGTYRGDHIEIVQCTVPMKRDVRSTYRFDRKDPGHQLAAMLAWTKSWGTHTFVGEWHTHPEDHPVPSYIDRSTWRRITSRKDIAMAFIILGRVGIWAGVGRSSEVQSARLLPFEETPERTD